MRTILVEDLDGTVQKFEDLQRALLKAEKSASESGREVMANALFAMRWNVSLIGRQALDLRYDERLKAKEEADRLKAGLEGDCE